MSGSQQERYTLLKELGAGAMGEVWLATDTLLNRPVAIKYLTATDNTIHKDLFLSEAQMLASLNHPNITLIYDAVFDENRNQYYLVMEYVEGKSLFNLIEGWSGPLPLQITLDVAIGILEALQYAHDKGIVHRDIKPENVIIEKDGVKLTDFGLAGLMSLLADNTNYMVGTPAYISPEQIQGIATDGRSDLYSLGILLFEMLAGGHKPFEQHYGKLSQLLEAHIKEAPPSLRAISHEVPLALEHCILRLLAKNPDDRYPTAEAVLNIFHSIQARQKFSQPHLDLLDLETKPLVGRSSELKQIIAQWAEVQRTAQPHLLTIQGSSGIGKSSLVTEFLGRHIIDQGFTALVGRCDTSGMPYTPFAEIVAIILNKGLAKSKTLTPEQLAQVLNYIPNLGRLLDIPDTGQTAKKERPRTSSSEISSGIWRTLEEKAPTRKATALLSPDQWQFFATILTLLGDLGPSIIFLEDATQLDEGSLALTQFLLKQQQLPLLVVVACRNDTDTVKWLDQFATNEKSEITLGPLSPLAIKDNLVNLLGGPVSEAAVNLIKRESLGNPAQIEELVRQLLDTKALHRDEQGQWRYTPPKDMAAEADSFLPRSVLGVFTRQIEKLSEMQRKALAVAAMIEPGAEFDFSVWVALLDGKINFTTSVRDEALKKRLLRKIGEDRYVFRPPDLAKALSSTLSQVHHREIHRQIANALKNRAIDPTLVGYHFEQAGLATEAATFLEVAGKQARATNNIKTAIVYYNRAVALVGSCSAYKALGNLYRQQGQLTDSLGAWQQALELAEQAENSIDQAQILNGLSFTLWLYDDYGEAYQPAAAVLKLVGAPETERAIAQSHLGVLSWLVGRLKDAEGWCQKAVNALLSYDDADSLAEAYNRLGLVHLSQGKFDSATNDFQQAIQLRQKLGDRWGEAYARNGLGRVTINQGKFDEALNHLKLARQYFKAGEGQDGLIMVYKNLGRVFLHQNRPDEALPWFSKALHLALKVGQHRAYSLADIYLLIAQAGLMRDELKLAHSATTDALELVQVVGNQEYICLANATLAQIYAKQQNLSEAEELFRKAMVQFEAIGNQAELIRTEFHYGKFLFEHLGQTAEGIDKQRSAREAAKEIGLYLPKKKA